MAKNTTPSFVVTRRIITDDRGYDKLNKIMRITERMYNAGVRHCIKQLNELKKDVWYKYCLQLPQGSYPSAINSSLLPLNSSLFFAFIFLTLLQSGLWNFPVFVLITSASRSLPDFERGFRPACEVKTGTFDPRTTFCRPVIPHSSLITNSACSALSVSAFSTTAFPS